MLSCTSNLKQNIETEYNHKIRISHSCFVYYGKAFQDYLYKAGKYWNDRGKPNVEITESFNSAPIICYKTNLPNDNKALLLGRGSNYLIEILYNGLAVGDNDYCQPKYNWRLSVVLTHELGHFWGESHETSKYDIMKENAGESCVVP